MFQILYRRAQTIRAQLAAPFAEARQSYVEHLAHRGYALATIRAVARDILGVAERLKLVPPAKATMPGVEAAVDQWMQADRRSSLATRRRIVNTARSWLRFSGLLAEPERPRPFGQQVDQFARYMREERGLAPETISSRLVSVHGFLSWLQPRKPSLADVALTDVDCYLATKGREGWRRRTVATNVQRLRAFFRYAEQQGWCRSGIAAGIEGPRLYGMENVPLGPSWEEVQALVASTDGGSRRDLRDRAALLLFAVYGLRCSEVRQLRLDDIDWSRETLTVRRAKSRKTQEFPLTREVGDAIIRYVRDVRPKCEHREVFITLKAPGLCRSSGVKGNLVADAYLAAMAIESGSEWMTTDRDYSRFNGLRWRHPFD